MTPEKASNKMRGSVLAYLAHKGINSSLNPSLTFAELAVLLECCDPLALEPEEARSAALARLAVLSGAEREQRPEPSNALERMASEILDPQKAAAVRGYARKSGFRYLHWITHKIMHPRGKGKRELAEAWLKKAEAEIEINGYDADKALQTRCQALTMAAACLA